MTILEKTTILYKGEKEYVLRFHSKLRMDDESLLAKLGIERTQEHYIPSRNPGGSPCWATRQLSLLCKEAFLSQLDRSHFQTDPTLIAQIGTALKVEPAKIEKTITGVLTEGLAFRHRVRFLVLEDLEGNGEQTAIGLWSNIDGAMAEILERVEKDAHPAYLQVLLMVTDK